MPKFDQRPAETSEIRGGESGNAAGFFFKFSFSRAIGPHQHFIHSWSKLNELTK
jgi:hypothetical protein